MRETGRAKLGSSLSHTARKGAAVAGAACLAALIGLLPGAARAQSSGALRIRVTGASFTVGSPGRFTISIRNESGIHADRRIRVMAELPPGLSFLEGYGAGWACGGESELLDCWTTDLPPKSRRGLSVRVGVGEEAAPQVTTVFYAFYEDDSVLAATSTSRTTRVKAGRAMLRTPTPRPTATPTSLVPSPLPSTVAVSGVLRIRATGAPFTVGTVGRYTIALRNESGIYADRQIRVISQLPRGLSFVEGYGAGWVCGGRPDLVDCWTTDLPPYARKGLTVKVGVGEEALPEVLTTFVAFYEDENILGRTSTSRVTKIRPSLVVVATPTPTPTPTLDLPCKTPSGSGSC